NVLSSDLPAHDLVDAVSQLISTILDVYARLTVINIASIDIGITRHLLRSSSLRRGLAAVAIVHVAAVQADRLQFAMQRRALHPNEGRGARDIAAEARHLGQQILALEDFARVAQRPLHDLATPLTA